MCFLKNNSIKIFAIVVVILSLPLILYAAKPEHIEISSSENIVNQPTTIIVTTHNSLALFTTWTLTVTDFGDGSPATSGTCSVTGAGQITCSTSFTHTYSNTGTFVFKVNVCDALRPSDCLPFSANINIGTAPTPGTDPTPDSTPSVQDELNPLKYNSFGELFDSVVGVIFWIASIVGPLFIVAGGFVMLFAGTNPSNIILGKKIILYTAIIFGIILMIKIMTYYFKSDLSF